MTTAVSKEKEEKEEKEKRKRKEKEKIGSRPLHTILYRNQLCLVSTISIHTS